MDHQEELKSFKPDHEYFVGIDSDGCVFDSMEVKQKEFFIPTGLKYFDLFPVSRLVRETWEFVNLFSVHRGVNRFPALIRVFDLLGSRQEIIDSGCRMPDLSSLKKWVSSETKLGNSTLRQYCGLHPDPDLWKVLEWSEAVNSEIGRWLRGIPYFPWARPALKVIAEKADSMIVSQTPLEALEREWGEHDLSGLVKFIAGQEHGTKAEHILHSAVGKYSTDKILLIGDAFGDLDAAQRNGILFYPIVPGRENESWKHFMNEGFLRFLDGRFGGDYESGLIKEFKNSLPVNPPWSKG